MLFAVTLAIALLPSNTPAVGERPWSAQYRVEFGCTDSGTPRAVVTATLRARRGSGGDEVELSLSQGYPGGYGRFVHGFEALWPGSDTARPSYTAETVSAAEGRYKLPVLKNGQAGFRYTVVLDHDPSEGVGHDDTPQVFQGGVFWTGRALFVVAAGSEIELTLVPPEGQRVTTAFAPVSRREQVYSVADENDLQESMLTVGESEPVRLEVGGATISLVVVTATAPQGVHDGSVVGHGLHVAVDAGYTADDTQRYEDIVAHELFHFYTPTLLRFDSREMWFSEGFTDYYSALIRRRLGRLDDQEYLAIIQGRCADYLEHAGQVGLREAGRRDGKIRPLIYQGGALLALCLDLRIRHATSNRQGLDDALRELYRRCGSGQGHEVPLATFERSLVSLGGKPLDGFLTRHLDTPEPLPLRAVFALAGVELRDEQLEIHDRDVLAGQLRCPGMFSVGDGIVIQRSDGRLRAEDVLIELCKQRVGDYSDACRALAGKAPGSQVRAQVLREGRRTMVEFKLGRPDEIKTERIHSVRLTPAAKSTRKAVQLREAVFGAVR